jgi:hypothetical protein
MKTLQIWLGNTIDEGRMRCQQSVAALSDDYTIICNNPALFPAANTILYDSVYDTYLDKYGNREWWRRYGMTNALKSDFLRLMYAIENGDLFYVDIDVELLYAPTFPKDGKVYFGSFSGVAEFFMFYVNGQGAWFEKLVKDITQGPDTNLAFMKHFLNLNAWYGASPPWGIVPQDSFVRHYFKGA